MAKFKGYQFPFQKSGSAVPLGVTPPQLLIASIKQILLTEQGERCLVGETQIPLLDGSVKPIKTLVGEGSFWVYSLNPSGEIVPGLATAHQTGVVTRLVEITLDNRATITCTPDHLIMLKTGTYVRAAELATGTSLMPLYRKISSTKKPLGYEMCHAGTGAWKFTHRIVAATDTIRRLNESGEAARARTNTYVNRFSAEGRILCSSEWGNWRQAQPKNGAGVPIWDTVLRYRTDLLERNHAVVSIRTVEVPETPVYDLRVGLWHNFALEAGVFVHNCMRPDFGTTLRRKLFENIDAPLVKIIQKEVVTALARWEPRIEVTLVEVTQDEYNPGQVNVNVQFVALGKETETGPVLIGAG